MVSCASMRVWLCVLLGVCAVLLVAPAPSTQAHLPLVRIPVVFHVLQQGGNTVSDEQLKRELVGLNNLYRGANAARNARDQQFDSDLASDTGFRFTLAVKDAAGNAITGINRINTALANTRLGCDDRLFDANQGGANIYPSDRYMNVIVHPSLTTTSCAAFPANAPHAKDAIVLHADFVDRKVNTGSHLARAVGRWLSLFDTFNGRSCTVGTDFISDTPTADVPAISYVNISNPCPSNSSLAPQRCGNPTMIGNFMDVNFEQCTAYLSVLQFGRMRALLTASSGVRSQLRFSPGLPPIAGACTPNCFNRNCGTDGCGGTCGQCDNQAFCSGAGVCTFGTPVNAECASSSLLSLSTTPQVISTVSGITGVQESCGTLKTSRFNNHRSPLHFFFPGTGRRVRISTCLPRTKVQTSISVFKSFDCTLDATKCLGSLESFGYADSCNAGTSIDCSQCVGDQSKAAQIDFCTQLNQIYRFVVSVEGNNPNAQPVDISIVDLNIACNPCTPNCPVGAQCGPDGCGGQCGSCDNALQTCTANQCVFNTNANSQCPAAIALAVGTAQNAQIFGATPLTAALPACTVGGSTLVGAPFQPARAVWYSIALPAANNFTVKLQVCSNTQDTRLSLYREGAVACNVGQFKCVAQADGVQDAVCNPNFGAVVTTCIQGSNTRYYLLVDSVSGAVDSIAVSLVSAVGNGCVAVEGPSKKKNVIPHAVVPFEEHHSRQKRNHDLFGANHNCANSLFVSIAPTNFTAGGEPRILITDLPATTSGTDAACFPPTGRQLWYRVTGNGNRFTASTCASGTTVTATRVHITSGTCASASTTCVAFSDNNPSCPFGAGLGAASACTTVGTFYYVVIEVQEATVGQVQLTLTDGGAPCQLSAANTCANPTQLAAGVPVVVDLGATSLKRILNCNPGSLSVNGGDLANGWWFQIIPGAPAQKMTVSTCATGFVADTVVNVYSVSSATNPGACDITSPVICETWNDNAAVGACAANNNAAVASFCSRANRNYYALVSTKNGAPASVQVTLTAGACDICTPTCTETTNCGSDGCGGTCGRFGGNSGCQTGESCSAAGQCVCQSDCALRECGNDICGNSCNKMCSTGLTCAAGKCSNITNNDACPDAIKLTSVSTQLSSTLAGRTLDLVPTCNAVTLDPPGAPGVWFSVTGNGQQWTITTCSPFTETDTIMMVFSGVCSGLQCVTANDNDDTCSSPSASTVSFTAIANTPYFILVTSKFQDSQDVFRITSTSTGAGAIIPDSTGGSTLPGGSITFQLEIDPIPTAPVTFHVESGNSQIIVPSHTEVTFTRGQQFATLVLSSPSNGRIGTAEVILRPDDPLRYQPLTLGARVLGRLSVSAPAGCTGVNSTYEVTVTFIPPPPVITTFLVSASNAQIAPTTLVVAAGQRRSVVSITGTNPSIGATISFAGSPYITAAAPEYEILGEIRTDLSSAALLTGALRQSTISFNPPPSRATTFNFAISGGTVTPSTVTVAAGQRSLVIDVVTSVPGQATFTASGTGYCPISRTITSTASNLACPAGQAPTTNGMACAPCPGGADNTCNRRGTCRFSKCISTATTCQCLGGFSGYACQFDSSDISASSPVVTTPLTSSKTLTIGQAQGLTYDLQITVPFNVTGTGTGEVATLVPLQDGTPFFDAVDPTTVQPRDASPNNVPRVGFSFEVTCADNTRLGNRTIAANTRVDILISNVRERRTRAHLIPDDDFQFLDLFRWDGTRWVEVTTECPVNEQLYATDLAQRTIRARVCKLGQFQLFVLRPQAVTPAPVLARPVVGGTGLTGFQPQAPPLPRFTPDERRTSPVRKPLASSASSLSLSLGVIFSCVMVSSSLLLLLLVV